MERRIRVRTEDNFVVDLTKCSAAQVTPWPKPSLAVKKLRPDALVPTRGSEQAIGLDLYAVDKQLLPVGGVLKVPTGIAVAIPKGHYGRVAPRSGLAAKHGIDVLAGVIDADYRGEIVVILVNHGREPVWVEPGMRVAQLILERASIMPVEEVGNLDDTARGIGGFGSTGH